MMGNDKLKKNGGEGTKVGNFLRSINFSDVVGVVGKVASGDISGAIKIISNDETLSEEQRAFALQVMQLDIEEMKGVSERWSSDMKSDSWLSKNIRPMSLIFLTVSTVLLIFLDFYNDEKIVADEWIELLKSLLLGVYIAYFGSRGLEKYRTIENK